MKLDFYPFLRLYIYIVKHSNFNIPHCCLHTICKVATIPWLIFLRISNSPQNFMVSNQGLFLRSLHSNLSVIDIFKVQRLFVFMYYSLLIHIISCTCEVNHFAKCSTATLQCKSTTK